MISWHFPIFVFVSFVMFVVVLRAVLIHRIERPPTRTVLLMAVVIVVGGMSFAKFGTSLGLPVWVYYGVPALLTWMLPPVVFRMGANEFGKYIIIAALVAPLIHALFSFFLGWKEYMPFIPIPSISELF